MSTSKQNYLNSVSSVTNYGKVMYLPGSIVGNRYQIIQKLGRSEMEKTYLAKDLQATGNVRCVVEQFDFENENDADWQIIKQYLLNEAVVLQRLGDHPQIPQLQHYYSQDKHFYLVREYIDGNNLEQAVKQKVFNEADTVYLIQDGLRILDFVHKTNAIHGNVQPDNLVRRKEDDAYVLIDFGMIREIKAAEINLQGASIVNTSVGNWVYAAPEQKAGQSHFSSDIYALAKSAVYALTGRSPFELEQTNLDWRSQCQISVKLRQILAKMMSPIIEQRYSSALEVLQDLRPLLKLKQSVGGRYAITNYLGGKAGVETYLADNLRRQYQSPCLIKQIELSQSDVRDRMQLERRFTEELSVLERLGYHDQIPQLWDHFEENDEFYLVQEYVEGKNLAQEILEKSLSISQIMQILDSSLSVLQFIHQNRLIHRNIKPSNLIIREQDRQVVITDFGILNEIRSLPNSQIESQNFARLNYWSPEQTAGRPTISSDLYALGMSIIEALTGTKPARFERDESGKLLWAQNVNLDRRSIRIIDKLIQLDLGQRYQSAEKVLNDLDKIGSHGSIDRPAVTQLMNVPTLRQRKPVGLPIIIGLLGILCLIGSIEFAFPILRPIYYWQQGKRLLPEAPEAALNNFTKAIDLKPESWRGWSGRGDALSIMERYPQALEAYIEATSLNPANADYWIEQGNTLVRLENFTEAIAAYNQALELAPEDATIYSRKGKALFQLQQYEAALVMQNAALERDRLNPEFLSDRAQTLFQLGRYEDAESIFNRVRAIEPNQLELWQDKFLVLEALNRPEEAEKVRREINNGYIQQVQQQPQNAALWLAQGDFFTAAQMFGKAEEAYERVLELQPNKYEALIGKGQSLAQQGRFTEALEILDRTQQIRPQSSLALYVEAEVYRQQNNLTQAIANYERAVEISPNSATVWRDLGIVLNQLGRYTQGINSLTKASELNPYDTLTWSELARALRAIGKNSQAMSAVEQGLKYSNQNSELWSLKGSILTENGQYNEACQIYRQSRKAIAVESPTIVSSMRQLGCRF